MSILRLSELQDDDGLQMLGVPGAITCRTSYRVVQRCMCFCEHDEGAGDVMDTLECIHDRVLDELGGSV